MKIGIMGGTFNPPHMGHLNAATAAKENIPLDKLILIPAGIPPHKKMAENSASVRVLEKCGFEKLFEGMAPYQGQERAVCRYIFRI